MNVLQLNLTDWNLTGGTGISMQRLHTGLRQAGIVSHVLSKDVQLPSPETFMHSRSLLMRALEWPLGKIASQSGFDHLHTVASSLALQRAPAFQSADILHLHCLRFDFLSYLTLPTLTRRKPAVYTVHDMWAYTGFCDISHGCTRFQTGCGQCPKEARRRWDTTRLEWKLKRRAYHHSRLAFVAPSRWQEENLRQSMVKDLPIHHIPHGLDTDLFRPLDKAACRVALGIDPRKKVLMFGATDLKFFYKGTDLLIKALAGLPSSIKSEIILLSIGTAGEEMSRQLDMPGVHLGFVDSDQIKAVAYAAADLFVYPTRADNAPLVLTESLACGTPIVSFRVGGVPDQVRPGMTGYLAAAEDADDLRTGVTRLLEDDAAREQMSRLCREIAVKEYGLELCVQRYLALYREMLGQAVASRQPASPQIPVSLSTAMMQ